MSTATHTLDEVQGRDDPANIFRRYVFEDPCICSNCFRRVRVGAATTIWGSAGHDKEDKRSRASVTRRHRLAPHEIGPEGPVVEYDPEGSTNGEKAIYPERTVCEDCGSVGAVAPDDTLSKPEAVRRAGTLADRLAELGEPVDEYVLKKAVEKLKADPRLVGYDTEIFERATKIAVRRSR